MESDWYYSTKGNICRFTADSETDDQDADDRDFLSAVFFRFYYPMSSYVRFGQLYWRCTGFQKEILKYVSAKERKDEFGEMNRVFNETTRKIEELMHEVTNSKLLNKEMEFKALQAQINPHFLYNALDTVNWMAMKKRRYRDL